MQAHTLGEVGNLGTVSLRVSSGTIIPIFIEIGSYLTDKEQKISWHSFFETRCSIFLVERYAQWFPPTKIMENSVRDISSCRRPTDAILSRIVDLNALCQHPVSLRHFRFRFCRYWAPKVFDRQTSR